MKFSYTPNGVCSWNIDIEVEGDTVKEVKFSGGCSGNSQGVSALVKGQRVDDVINKLSGIKCGIKSTSCPDQLALALKMYKTEMSEQ